MKQLFEKAHQALIGRKVWEDKQRLYYQMRHDGLRRRNKPFPTAADLHFPLVDMQIAKQKPFWEAQALASERLAMFVALKEQQAATTEAAADWFDWTLKQFTRFEDKLTAAIDVMLLRGRGVLKATIDPLNGYALVFEAIDPLFILIPQTATDLDDADWFVHVKTLTRAQYERERRFNQDPEVIKAISGGAESTENNILQDKQTREGITHSVDTETVILWEHYEKTLGGWTIHTYCPQAPHLVIRKSHGVPYKYQGKASLPFFSFSAEMKDEGWFSPRGVAEKLAPFESYSCKLWNEKADAMTFAGRPVFTSDKDIANTTNLRWNPGEFLPGNIRAIQMPAPSMSFDQELMFTRQTSEQLLMTPDFGVADMASGGAKPRTATENNRISGLMNMGAESNGRQFRRSLARLYRHVWGMMLQFRREELSYYVAGELKTLPEQALHDNYLVFPDGSPDQWDKQQKFQRSVARFQMFSQDPNVDREVLVRDVLAADDPRLAVKAFIPANVKAASESEDEAVEILLLMQGYPAAVKPYEDHATRVMTLMQKLEQLTTMGVPVNPMAQQRLQEHLVVHMQYLEQTQPEAAAQMKQQIALASQPQMPMNPNMPQQPEAVGMEPQGVMP
jgi:hypothetical protein